ncbi:MAG: glycosyltransferase 61 family protein [Aquabacterium sp.]
MTVLSLPIESCAWDAEEAFLEPPRRSGLESAMLQSRKLTRLFMAEAARSYAPFGQHGIGGVDHLDVLAGRDDAFNVGLYEVEDAVVAGHSSLLWQQQVCLHHDLLSMEKEKLREEDQGRVFVDVVRQRIHGPLKDEQPHELDAGAIFTDAMSFNYAHWLTEVLPRVALLSRLEKGQHLPFLVDDGLHPNMHRSLLAVVNPGQRIFFAPRDRQVKVRRSLVVGAAGYIPYHHRGDRRSDHTHGMFSSEALQILARRVRQRFGSDVLPRPRKIYVKRNSDRRMMRGAELLEAALHRLGFVTIEPEKLSFDEQVRTFQSAEVVVGATGAALANILFCRAGTRAIVLMARHVDMPYQYWARIGACVGVEVASIICEPMSLQQGLHDDFKLSPTQLDELMEAVSAER